MACQGLHDAFGFRFGIPNFDGAICCAGDDEELAEDPLSQDASDFSLVDVVQVHDFDCQIFMYSSLIPLLVPIFTFGLFLSFFCKKYIFFHYSVRLPANENLAIKVMNLLPFIILVHGLMGVWSHTTTGIFASSSFVITLNVSTSSSVFIRALTDVLMLGATAAVLAWIVIDWIIIGIISSCRDCCKDDL